MSSIIRILKLLRFIRPSIPFRTIFKRFWESWHLFMAILCKLLHHILNYQNKQESESENTLFMLKQIVFGTRKLASIQ